MVWPQSNHTRQTRQWLLVFLCFAPSALAQPVLIDRSVALIDGHVLTLSELQFDARVILIHLGGVEAAYGALDQTTLRSVLESVIGQRLEMAEADKLRAYPLEEGELERALAGFAARLGGPGELDRFLKTHDADQSMLALVLTRMLRTERMLDGKLRLKAQVSEAEAKNLQSERPDLVGLALPVLRQKLFNERFKTLAAAELAQVRKTGNVRLLGPFSERFVPDAGSP